MTRAPRLRPVKLVRLGRLIAGSAAVFLADAASATGSDTEVPRAPRVVFAAPDWPLYVELDHGAEMQVELAGRPHRLRLVSTADLTEPNGRIVSGRPPETLRESVARIEFDSTPAELRLRPYQLPVVVGDARIYLEATARNAAEADFVRLEGVQRHARIALRPRNAAWGPTDLRFPLADYRWRGTTFNNTWGAMVPSHRVYYHRGEDFGAVFERHAVLAAFAGVVEKSPLPHGDGRSNEIVVTRPDGVAFRASHCNVASVARHLVPGARVAAGEPLALTGNTNNGGFTMVSGTHLHWNLQAAGTRLGSFPFVVEAYFRDHPDPAVAITGGFTGTHPGRPVTLDATRSLVRPGETIARVEWHLSDGTRSDAPTLERVYDRPGVYAEELRLWTASGHESRDTLEVAVYDPAAGTRPGQLPRGWILVHPLREVRPGARVQFFYDTADAPVVESRIDFGDGTPPAAFIGQASHTYASPGLYTATVTTPTSDGHLMTRKISVRVEPASPAP